MPSLFQLHWVPHGMRPLPVKLARMSFQMRLVLAISLVPFRRLPNLRWFENIVVCHSDSDGSTSTTPSSPAFGWATKLVEI